MPRINEFDATASEPMGYLIGAMLSDGSAWMHIHSKRGTREFRLQFDQIDKEMVDKIASCLRSITGRDYPIRRFEQPGKTTSWRLLAYGNAFVEWLITQTKNKQRIPAFWPTASAEFKKALVSGLLDGDGWIHEGKTKAGSPIWKMGCVTADDWLEDLVEVLSSLGVGVYDREKNRISVSGRTIWQRRIRMAEFANVGCYFSIQRKRERLERFIAHSVPSEAIRRTPEVLG